MFLCGADDGSADQAVLQIRCRHGGNGRMLKHGESKDAGTDLVF